MDIRTVFQNAILQHAEKSGFSDSNFCKAMSDMYLEGRVALAQFVHTLNPKATLEIGSGLGIPTTYLHLKGVHAEGFDIDYETVEAANSLAAKLGLDPLFFVEDFYNWIYAPTQDFLIFDQPKEFEPAAVRYLETHNNPFVLVPYLSVTRNMRSKVYAEQLNARIVTLNMFYDAVVRNVL